jgi:phosphotriesterase-related protein
MSKKVVTVLGERNPESLGIVLTHEHLLWDLRCWAHDEPRELFEREKIKQPVSLENRGHVVYHPFYYHDNLYQTDTDITIDEVNRFRNAGGGTICDVTPESVGRDPAAQYRIAMTTGLNIIMSCALYVAGSWNDEEKELREEEIIKKILAEFQNGVGPMRIKPGILGEIGVSDIDNPFELKSLRASGAAQNELGCPVSVHTPIWEKEGNRILDILEKAGADTSKITLCHLDPTMRDLDYADSLAKRGVYISYDLFDTHIMSFEGIFLPCDNERIDTIKEQIKRGNLKNILVSHDNCMKIKLTRWGGHGYAHILENIVPRLLREGVTSEQVETILVENPKRFLSW